MTAAVQEGLASAQAPSHDARAVAANALPDYLCYLEGRFQRLCDARVSVLDRGFIFGDGVYEVVPVYGGKLFRFEEHMQRLARNLAKVRITAPAHTKEQWLELMRTLVKAQTQNHGFEDQLLYLQVTRGVAMRDHVMPSGIEPTLFMMTTPLKVPTAQQRHEGVACVTARDFRWERADIKSTSLLGNVMARQMSADQQALETVMLREGGQSGHLGPWLTEAAASNVWVVREGALLGPPKSGHLLEGIRVELLRELCESCGVAYNLCPISEAELRSADEVLLSSATKEILAVTTLDGERVGHGAMRGKPGPVYARLYEAYQRAKLTQSI
jgi:D-alanine transaminase